jgi:hypothetical protein
VDESFQPFELLSDSMGQAILLAPLNVGSPGVSMLTVAMNSSLGRAYEQWTRPTIDAEIQFLFEQLDTFVEELEQTHYDFDLIAGKTVIATGAVSAGLFIWAARASYFVTMLSTSLPAWAVIDPVPVLDAEAIKGRTGELLNANSGPSLAELVDEQRVPVSVHLLDERLASTGVAFQAETRRVASDMIVFASSDALESQYVRLSLTTATGERMNVIAAVTRSQASHASVESIEFTTQVIANLSDAANHSGDRR